MRKIISQRENMDYLLLKKKKYIYTHWHMQRE